MRLDFSERLDVTDIRTQTLRDAQAFVQCWDEIAALRAEPGVEDDALLDPLHFLTTTDSRWRSCSVACWSGDRLIGLVYSIEHVVRGIGLGYAFGGDYCGRGMLLCRPEHEAAVVQAAIERIMADGVHSLHLRFLPRDTSKPELAGMDMMLMDGLIEGDRIALSSSFDGFLGTLGKHTRRNVRYYTRKARAAGIEFVPSLTRSEYEVGVSRLNAKTQFPTGPLRLARDERLLALHRGGERLGLRGPDGNLVAILCGFTRGKRFHVLTQLNDIHFERLSLSTVLRGYSMQHLIGSGHTEVQFVGGSSRAFGRFCAPQMYRSIFIDRGGGIVAAAKRFSSKIVKLRTSMGRPVPEILKIVCNGYLEEWRLVEGTALKPGGVTFSKSATS